MKREKERRAGEEDVQEEEGQEERKDVQKERKSQNKKRVRWLLDLTSHQLHRVT